MFQFFKPPFSANIKNFTKFAVLEPKFTKFTQNFRSKAANLAKIQFFKPYFFQKNQFFKPLFLVPTRSLLKPPFVALRAAHLYKNESWVPPPGW